MQRGGQRGERTEQQEQILMLPRDVDYALSGMRCIYIPEDAAEEEEP